MSRKITKKEAEEKLIKKMLGIARYWSGVEGQTDKEKCEGVVFSILAMFDGCEMNMPAMDIVLRPHEEDKEFCKEVGENWFEDGMAINDDTMLHEMLHKYE